MWWVYKAGIAYGAFGVCFSAISAFIFGLKFEEEGRPNRPSWWVDTLLRFPAKNPCSTLTGDYTFNVIALAFFWPVVIVTYIGFGLFTFARGIVWLVKSPFRLGRYLARRRVRLPKAKVLP